MQVPTDPALASTADVARVIQAFLSPAGASSDKQAADVWLRQWQQTPQSWVQANELLLMDDVGLEVHQLSASTLTTKIMFDVYQLSDEDKKALAQSLLESLVRFREKAAPLHFTSQLAVALADLSVQMIDTWTNPIETLFQILGLVDDDFKNCTTQYSLVLVICLRILVEESFDMRKPILASTEVREGHRRLMYQGARDVLVFLEEMNSRVENPPENVKVEIYECFIQWLPRADHSLRKLEDSRILSTCFSQILTSEAALRVISCTAGFAVDQPLTYAVFLDMCLRQLTGPLRTSFGDAVQEENWEVLYSLAITLNSTLRAIATDAAFLVGQDAQLQEALLLLLLTTATPYTSNDYCLGENGISSQAIVVWQEIFSVVKNCMKDATDPSWVQEAIGPTVEIGVRLLNVLVKQATIPEDILPMSSEDRKRVDAMRDFNYYRGMIFDLLRIMAPLVPNEALVSVFVTPLLEALSASVPTDYRHVESLLRLTAVLPPSTYPTEITSIFPSIWPLGQPPSSHVEAYCRSAAADVAANFSKKACSSEFARQLPGILESLVDQMETLTKSGHEFACRRAATAVRALLDNSESTIAIQPLLPALSNGLMPRIAVMNYEPSEDLLAGLGAAISSVESDDDYVLLLNAVLSPLLADVQAAADGAMSEKDAQPSGAIMRLRVALDRVATCMFHLAPWNSRRTGTGCPARVTVVGSIVRERIVPLAFTLLQAFSSDEETTDKSLRVVKHSMRAVGGGEFRAVLSPLSELLVQLSSKIIHSSYLYAVEYLAMEYAMDDAEVLRTLNSLFNSLAARAVGYIKDQTRSGVISYDGSVTTVLEDFYGMVMRYFNFLPFIVGASPSLEGALECTAVAISEEQPVTMKLLFQFLESYASHLHDDETEAEGFPLPELVQRFAEQAVALFTKHIPAIMVNLFTMLSRSPQDYVVDGIKRLCESLINNLDVTLVDDIFQEAIKVIPVAALGGDSGAVAILNKLTDVAMCDEVIDDLYFRCQKIVMRNRGVMC